MPTDIKLELRCVKNDDGTFNAGSYDDVQQLADPKFSVANGTCEDIRTVHKHLQEAYPNVAVQVGEACSHCITDDT